MLRTQFFLKFALCIFFLAVLAFYNNMAEAKYGNAQVITRAGDNVDENKVPVNENVIGALKADSVVRILAIGNSFSVDALENYLYDLVKAAGKKVIIGNLAIAGGSLEQHVANSQNNLQPYIYTKIGVDGSKTTTFNNAIEPVVQSEPWDYISLQQVSNNSGLYETFVKPLPALHKYVKERTTNPAVKFVLHQTWAYAKASDNPGFANYKNDQQVMYEAIISTYSKAKALMKAALVIPAGTAIQNARTSFVGDNFTKDGYHLEHTYARYVVACTWFEKLFNQPVIGNSYKPSSISDYYKDMAQHAAHAAVRKPNKVTVLRHYRKREE